MTNADKSADKMVIHAFLTTMFKTKPVREVAEYFDNLLSLVTTDADLREAFEVHYLMPASNTYRAIKVKFLERVLERLGLPTEVKITSSARHLIACELRKRLASENGIVVGSRVMAKSKGPYSVIAIDDQGYVVTDGPGRAYRPDNIELVH